MRIKPLAGPVAQVIAGAMRDKGLTVSETARRSEVDRVWLTNLRTGSNVPRQKRGHLTAEHDSRYERLAKTLGLEVGSFIQLVKKEQLSEYPAKQPLPENYHWALGVDTWRRFLGIVDNSREQRPGHIVDIRLNFEMVLRIAAHSEDALTACSNNLAMVWRDCKARGEEPAGASAYNILAGVCSTCPEEFASFSRVNVLMAGVFYLLGAIPENLADPVIRAHGNV